MGSGVQPQEENLIDIFHSGALVVNDSGRST
jgi:hypothetical protein